MKNCLTDLEIFYYIEGLNDSDLQKQYSNHINKCSYCFESVTDTINSIEENAASIELIDKNFNRLFYLQNIFLKLKKITEQILTKLFIKNKYLFFAVPTFIIVITVNYFYFYNIIDLDAYNESLKYAQNIKYENKSINVKNNYVNVSDYISEDVDEKYALKLGVDLINYQIAKKNNNEKEMVKLKKSIYNNKLIKEKIDKNNNQFNQFEVINKSVNDEELKKYVKLGMLLQASIHNPNTSDHSNLGKKEEFLNILNKRKEFEDHFK